MFNRRQAHRVVASLIAHLYLNNHWLVLKDLQHLVIKSAALNASTTISNEHSLAELCHDAFQFLCTTSLPKISRVGVYNQSFSYFIFLELLNILGFLIH